MSSDINLFQWYQYDSGACFNLQFNTRSNRLNIDARCRNAAYDHQVPSRDRVELRGPVYDVWHDFVVHANWASNDQGFFRVLYNGELVMNYSGPTLARSRRTEVNEAAFIYRYGSSEAPAARFWQTPSTVWFDDIIRTRDIGDIERRFDFARSTLGLR